MLAERRLADDLQASCSRTFSTTLHQESAPLLWLSLDDERDRSQRVPNRGYRVDEGGGSVVMHSEMHLSCDLCEWERCREETKLFVD